MKKTIAFVTDIHFNEHNPLGNPSDPHKNWKTLLADILVKNPDALVIGGDVGEASSYEYFFNSLKVFPGELDILAGNHDTTNNIKRYFSKDAFPGVDGLYYSYADDQNLYIFLDSSADIIDENQLSWFTNELTGNRKNILLFMHHPVLPIEAIADKMFPLKNRETLKKILIEHGQPVQLFCGHYHTEAFTQEQLITQYITPAASFQINKAGETILTDASKFGYRMISIEGTNISSEVIWFSNELASNI